jgi:hypothetical protein
MLAKNVGHHIEKNDYVEMKLENNSDFEAEEPPLL